jgi:hypothetical protein
MKTELVTIKGLSTPVTFYIGRTQEENHDVIALGSSRDLWFHAANKPSCHVIAVLPVTMDRRQRGAIIRRGAYLCKSYTTGSPSAIMYAPLTHVTPVVDIPGQVTVTESQIINV